jgi:DNA end-binding protein Ku
MATASTRTTWKGAISFGLVHIPIELRTAVIDTRESFRMIDPKSQSAVGYQTVSKATGQAISADQVVKGVQYDEGRYVTLTREEIRAALPKSTQTIEIEAFVDAGSIPFNYYAKPYHVAPLGKGQKAFKLLHDTLIKTGKAGIARVVISTKQHLAALLPQGNGMVLNLLRWEEEVRTMEGLSLPDDSVKISDKEMRMAEMLVNDLAAEWSPGLFHDEFKEQLAALVEAKAKKGSLIAIKGTDKEEATPGAEIIDLTELLQRSLAGKGAGSSKARPAARSANDGKVTQLRAAAAKKVAVKASAVVKPASRRKAG